MRIVFMGTPEFAVPSLKALVAAGHDICGVFTQPDKPKNRGMKLQPTPVKEYALTVDIPVYQPAKMRDGEALAILRELQPQLIVVAAYGKILPVDILELPAKGCINVHSSLLPKYRGAAPINWAILNGEDESGVTIMYMAEGLDTGDIIASASTPISLEEDAQQLHDRLAEMGAELVTNVVAEMEEHGVSSVPQDDSLSCYAPMLSRELSPICWEDPARKIHDQVRGLCPWPSATAEIDGVRCKIFKTAITGRSVDQAPGTIVRADKKGLEVACGNGEVLEILELQPDGKKRMAATAFLMGHPIRL
ncbi:MAG: methionyl-tRNA formyltransferase [Oscillospiraceae bacterium]|nr:methionyl-tRNA formyltransferase [Oscillospiraceae bacterium]